MLCESNWRVCVKWALADAASPRASATAPRPFDANGFIEGAVHQRTRVADGPGDPAEDEDGDHANVRLLHMA
jgi:hypothetical protein